MNYDVTHAFKEALYIISMLLFISCGNRQFDSDKADSENNKTRFKEYIGVDITQDVKNIYCYGDFFGADYTILFSFNCSSETISKIIKEHNLDLSGKKRDSGLTFIYTFPWWDKEKIENIKPFKQGEEGKFWRYLWYDESAGKAYYQEFSM